MMQDSNRSNSPPKNIAVNNECFDIHFVACLRSLSLLASFLLVGAAVGIIVGCMEGECVGLIVGFLVGIRVGLGVGISVGAIVVGL